MKLTKVTAIAVIVGSALLLTGCNESTSTNVEDVAAAKAQCHEFGGIFTVYQSEYQLYVWECDLSDTTDKETK